MPRGVVHAELYADDSKSYDQQHVDAAIAYLCKDGLLKEAEVPPYKAVFHCPGEYRRADGRTITIIASKGSDGDFGTNLDGEAVYYEKLCAPVLRTNPKGYVFLSITPRGLEALKEDSDGGEPAGNPAERKPGAGGGGSGKRIANKADQTGEENSAEARALGILAANPGWTNTRIAVAAGVARTTLYKWPTFALARKAQKEAGKEHRRPRSVER